MTAILFVVFAGFLVAISNFCMRKSIDVGGTAQGFIALQMLTGFLVTYVLGPLQEGMFDSAIFLFGSFTGLMMAILIYCISKAIENGPPGFSFSIVASSAIMPGIVMTILFGSDHGFPYTPWHGIGSFLVIVGILWGGYGLESFPNKKRWLFFCLAMFAMQTIVLSLFQYRSLLLRLEHPEHIHSYFNVAALQSPWFTPAFFLTATLFHWILFLKKRRAFKPMELVFGGVGGAVNAFCTCLLLLSAERATPFESVVIFPIFSVINIVLTNVWGQLLYKEKINWRACYLSLIGLVIATVDWSYILG